MDTQFAQVDPKDMAKKRLLHKATQITEMQIEEAKKMYLTHFGSTDNPPVMAAIIQALALNYATSAQPGGA